MIIEISVYMIDAEKDEEKLEYRSLSELENRFGFAKVDRDLYKEVFSGNIECVDLEDVFARFNLQGVLPTEDGGACRPMSVSDLVEVTEGNADVKEGLYYCDAIGFKPVAFFESEKDVLRDEGITVLYVEPGREARVETIGTSLQDLQTAVGGYIETYYPFDDSSVLVCNDEGKLNGMKPNRGIYDERGELMDIIFGPFFVCDASGENFSSLTDAQIDKYMDKFRQPEKMSRLNGQYIMTKVDKITEKER